MDADRLQVLICEEGTFGVTPTATKTAATIAAVASGNKLTDSGSGFVTAGFLKGMRVKVSGFTGEGTTANGIRTIVSVSDGEMVLRGGAAIVDDAAGESVTIAAGIMDEVRVTSESMAMETDTTVSSEIRDDRQKSDIIRTGRRASGDIAFEFSAEQFDELLSAGLMDDLWSDAVSLTGATIAAVASGNKLTDSGSGMDVFTAGEWIKISGFTGTVANNDYAKITSVAAGEIAIEGLTLVDDAAGESVTIYQLPSIVNGITKRSFTIERESEDETNLFTRLLGMYISQLQMTISASEIITGTFSFMGKEEETDTSTAAVDTVAASTNQVFSGVDHVVRILDNMTSTAITSLNFSINNNYREQVVLGTLGPVSMGSGSVDVSGSITKYFEDTTQLARYIAFTATSLAAILQDDDGNAYVIDMPNVKFTGNRHAAGGPDTYIMEEIDFQAVVDATEQVTFRIARYIP